MSAIDTNDRRVAVPAATAGIAAAAIVAGALGALLAVGQLVVPPAVPAAQFSYPFTITASAVVQVFLFLHHVVLAVAVLAVVRTGAAGGRLGAAGGWVAAAALVLLGGAELSAIAVAGTTTDTPLVDLVESAYGVFSVLLGAGMLVLGVAVVRAGRWTGWRRWVPLVIGIYVFIPMTPAVLGPFAIASLALAGWSLLFVALGAALRHP